jgi:hypothetical protein
MNLGAISLAAITAIVAASGIAWWAMPGSQPKGAQTSAPSASTSGRAGPRARNHVALETDDEDRAAPEEVAEARGREIADRTGSAAADGLVDRLASAIALEPEREEALRTLLKEERRAAAKVMHEEAPRSEELRRALDRLRRETRDKVAALLSAEQLAAYERIRPKPPEPRP